MQCDTIWRCNTLQHTATDCIHVLYICRGPLEWCNVMQCVAVHYSVLQCVAVCCSVLQCVAVCCSVLQCVAVCCSVLQRHIVYWVWVTTLKTKKHSSLIDCFFVYWVASTSRLLKIIGLFCKRALQKRRYSAKETYNFEEPTNRSHPIWKPQESCLYATVGWLRLSRVCCSLLQCFILFWLGITTL